MTSDLFVYGTLMRGYVHPMARLLSANAEFLGEATCRGRLYMVKHYPGLVLSDDAGDIVHGELYRLREVDAMLREFDMYEACGEGFPEPTQYLRRMLPVTSGGAHGPFNPACLTGKSCPPLFAFDTPDIIGTARPQSGRYDVGAWQK